MTKILIRPGNPESDFAQLAAWFTSLEEETTSEPSLKEYFEKEKARILQIVAEDEKGELMGFYWAVRDRSEPGKVYLTLYVKPEKRGQGIGRLLYEDMEKSIKEGGAKKIRASVWDNHPEWRQFLERRGFNERFHSIAMAADLEALDFRPFDEILSRFKADGYQFTSMEGLGNTEKAQRKLYALNDSAAMDIPDQEGDHVWQTFEDFKKGVCDSDWYKPGGQIVAIDTKNGKWAAMSAITRYEGKDSAYNLFTGVDRAYRGKKLGQAVKSVALRYARDVLNAKSVRTHHHEKNLPMIAIDRKFGYAPTQGNFHMGKEFVEETR